MSIGPLSGPTGEAFENTDGAGERIQSQHDLHSPRDQSVSRSLIAGRNNLVYLLTRLGRGRPSCDSGAAGGVESW